MIGKALVSVAAALTAGCVSGSYLPDDDDYYLMPPAEIRARAEAAYAAGAYSLTVLPPDGVQAICGGRAVHACATGGPLGCQVIRADDIPPFLLDLMMVHEIGHCFGWSPSHPNGDWVLIDG